MNTTNQTVLSLLAAMRAKSGVSGGTALANIKIDEANVLVDFVNNTAKSVESGLAALTIATENAVGLTPIADVISAATAYDEFINIPAPTPAA